MKRFLLNLLVVCCTWAGQSAADDDKSPAPDKNAIAKFLTEYQKTPFADRGKYVMDPKEFEQVQETFYKDRPLPDEIEVTVTSSRPGPKTGYQTVVAKHTIVMNGKKTTQQGTYYLVNAKGSLKMDWAASTGFNPIAFKAWQAGDDKTLAVRVEAQLSDYYNFHYADAKTTYYSIALAERFNRRSSSFHGYVEKDTNLGKKIFEIVKDGEKHKLTILIERTGKETSVVGIKELMSDSWVK